jgi:hypothetical protein
MDFIKYLIVFYAFKYKTPVIDVDSPRFWRWCVSVLNSRNRDGFRYSLIVGNFGFYVRDPFSKHMSAYYWESKWHPFVVRKWWRFRKIA